MDHPALTAISRVLGPVDGILGFPFFSHFRVALDYQAQQMTLTPVNYRSEDALDYWLMLLDSGQKPAKKVLSSGAVWGLVVDKAKDDERPGVDVKQVMPGSAAEVAGLHVGDRLLVLDATWTDSVTDCHRATASVRPGQTVKVKIERNSKEIELLVTPRPGL
jgi:predicted metalloprotease with PDZ domain